MPVERCFIFVSGFASVTFRSRGRPSRWTVTVTSFPPSAAATASRRSSPSSIVSLPSLRTMSPAFIPALPAGPSASTELTRTPVFPPSLK